MGAIRILTITGIGLWVGALLISAPAAAAPKDDWQRCANISGDAAIAACTRAIMSGQRRRP